MFETFIDHENRFFVDFEIINRNLFIVMTDFAGSLIQRVLLCEERKIL